MLLENKRVAIVGGGPGGLTLARLLQTKGVRVKVYERDKDSTVRQQGATLDLHYESGLKALRESGLIEEFRRNYRPDAGRLIVTDNYAKIHLADNSLIVEEDINDVNTRPEIDRGPLRELLINSLQDDTISWNSKFTELKAFEEGWELFFENGNIAYADVVVAADGANSKLRKYITDIQPIYSDVTIVEGNIYNASVNAPKLWKLTNGGKVFAIWDKKTIILSAKGDGSLSFYTGTREDANWVNTCGIDFENKDQVFDWFKIRFSDWGNEWHELFRSDELWFVPRPQYHFPLNQSWQAIPNLTIIGDAAHRMPPYAGEGVNQAMCDAVDLYEALCKENYSSILEAIASFERKMFVRTSQVTKETLENTEAFHSEDNFNKLIKFFSNNKTS